MLWVWDIGCGMCAVKTDLKFTPRIKKQLGAILGDIRKRIPVGFNHHKKAHNEILIPQNYDIDSMPIVKAEYTSALKQIGTLGGGNHFIEIQKDSDNIF